MKKITAYLGTSLFALAPMVALAQFGEVDSFINDIIDFINSSLIPLVFGVALLVFIWGMFKFFILGGGDEDSRKEGKQLMLWAVIGFVLMVSIWGIVNLISGGLGLNDEGLDNIPNTPAVNP